MCGGACVVLIFLRFLRCPLQKHAYGVLKVVELDGEKLVQLRRRESA